MTKPTDTKIRLFLQSLTELCHAYGLGITGSPTLFVLEEDDVDRIYDIDAESNLSFK